MVQTQQLARFGGHIGLVFYPVCAEVHDVVVPLQLVGEKMCLAGAKAQLTEDDVLGLQIGDRLGIAFHF